MSNRNVGKGKRPPVADKEYINAVTETVKRRQMLFKGLIQRVWPTVTGQEGLHFSRGNPTAPNGVPVHMEIYSLLNHASGKRFSFSMGRHGNDIWLLVDSEGKIVHFGDDLPDDVAP